jgi:hypothetical protein
MNPSPEALADQSARWVGRLIASRYRLLRVVGVGGHGAVYEAKHELTGRRFAVKLLLRDAREMRGLAERLVREARATSRVLHPNVVEVIDVGVDPETDRLYLIEEFLEGDDLRARMRLRRRMTAREVRAVIGPVLDGLGAAHAHGVVHRDLKPGNVMLARVGGAEVPKIIDFGISKIDRRDAPDGDESAPLTRDGMLLGTPDYMAPEQARGAQSVDARADLWSIGVLLFEMLAAVRPFRGVGPAGVIVAVAMEPPRDLAALRPDLPPAWVALVNRCLEKAPEARFPDARSLREAVDAAGDEDPTVALGELPESAADAPDTLASAPQGPIVAPLAPGLDEMLEAEAEAFSEAPAAAGPGLPSLPTTLPPVGGGGGSWRWVLLSLLAFAGAGALAWTRLRPHPARGAPARAAARWTPPPGPDAAVAVVGARAVDDTSALMHGRGARDPEELPPRLSMTQQRTVMLGFAPRVRQCVGPAFFGQLPVTVTARGDGTVRAVRVGVALRGSEAGRCVSAALRAVTVPRFGDREMEIAWVYVFAAQSQ